MRSDPLHHVPSIDTLLSHRPLGRILDLDGIADEFALIGRAWTAAGGTLPRSEDFARVGRSSGTHLLKLVSPRAPTGQAVLRISRSAVARGDNQRPARLVPSLDAKMAKVAKLVFRPLEIEGHPARHLVDHLLDPDDVSPRVTADFATVFGQDALDALREALTRGPSPIERLPVAEFPIVFVPRPGGGDLQVTPLAPAAAYVEFGDVTQPYGPEPRRGRWHRQHVSGKPQNISSAIGKQRTRFLATMPRVYGGLEAELHRYGHGGAFPRWRDEGVADAVVHYAGLVDRNQAHSNEVIRAGLDRRADALIAAVQAFVEQVRVDASDAYPDKKLTDPPLLADIILNRSWKADGRDVARRVLTGDHFRARLREAGHAVRRQ